MKRAFLTCILLTLTALLLLSSACQPREPTVDYEAIVRKLEFAETMNCYTTLSASRLGWFNVYNENYKTYTDCIFVSSEEEAEGYPANIIVCWPTEYTARNVAAMNNMIEFREVDVRLFMLVGEVTVDDLVYRTGSVCDLYYSFDRFAKEMIYFADDFLLPEELKRHPKTEEEPQ